MKTFETEKHNIPEGATHYINEDKDYHFAWAKYEREYLHLRLPTESRWNEVFTSLFPASLSDAVKPIPQTTTKAPTESKEEKEALDSINQIHLRDYQKKNKTEHQEEMSALSLKESSAHETLDKMIDDIVDTEWNGEGLPPVGVWFEISANLANTVWNKCRVVHYHNNLAWLDFECNEIMNLIKNLNNNVIRPTESPQQREERERLEAAYDLYCHAIDLDTPFDKFCNFGPLKDIYIKIVDKTNYRKESN